MPDGINMAQQDIQSRRLCSAANVVQQCSSDGWKVLRNLLDRRWDAWRSTTRGHSSNERSKSSYRYNYCSSHDYDNNTVESF
jgi:hypothetical protein